MQKQSKSKTVKVIPSPFSRYRISSSYGGNVELVVTAVNEQQAREDASKVLNGNYFITNIVKL